MGVPTVFWLGELFLMKVIVPVSEESAACTSQYPAEPFFVESSSSESTEPAIHFPSWNAWQGKGTSFESFSYKT